MDPVEPNEATTQQHVDETVQADPDCHLPSVILDDGLGTLLCLTGTGYIELDAFVHHYEIVPNGGFGGGFTFVPVTWNGQAKIASSTFFYAAFYKDNASDYFKLISPGEDAHFVSSPAGEHEVGDKPFSLSIW